MRNIIKSYEQCKDYHSALRKVIVVDGIMEHSLKLLFTSTNRDNTGCVIKFGERTESVERKYAAAGSMYQEVMTIIKSLLLGDNIILNQNTRDELINAICKCISKCESRYGQRVKDYYDYDADAIITLEGEHNGKDNYKVVFDGVEIEELDNLSIYGFDGYVRGSDWYIDKETSDLDEILSTIIYTFEDINISISADVEKVITIKSKDITNKNKE